MCGIHGIVDRSLSPHEVALLLQDMAVAQSHRGPDDQDNTIVCQTGPIVGMGFVRLSILDLETGMQPIVSNRTGSTIVCNGQVYNYRALRQQLPADIFTTKGDIETALHLYDHEGLNFLHRLNGMYAGAIYDPLKRQLVLFTDRFGIKPLYYADVEGRLVFASEVKALLKGLTSPAGVNRSGLPLYLSLGYMPGTQTLFDNIYRLEPGTCLVYDLATGSSSVSTYWQYSPAIDNGLTIDEAAARFAELLQDSVELRMHADVPVGALLSSGIDSSAVTWLAERADPQLSLYSVSFENRAFDESRSVSEFAKSWLGKEDASSINFTVCNRKSIDDLPEIIYHLDEPLANTSLLPTWQLFKMVGQQHKVVLSGEGADELFAGYGWFWLDPGIQRQTTGLQAAQLYNGCRSFFSEQEIGSLLNIEKPEFCLPSTVLSNLSTQSGPLETILQLESRCRMPASNLLRVDKLAMAHSVEARTPFLDYRIGEFAATLPADMKLGMQTSEQKYVCREAFHRHGFLPEQVARARKQPFCAPIDDWLRDKGQLPEFMLDIMEFNHPLFDNIVDPEVAQECTKGFLSDVTTPFTDVTATDRFWNLCVLAVWYDQFMT